MPNHILIVDDCEDIRFLLALKLNNIGFEVSEASDGEEALEILSEDHDTSIDIILLDVMMPNISGTELLEKIKKSKFNQDLKIICITAHFDNSLHEELMNLGAFDVIKKPIKGNELHQRLKKLYNKAG